MSFFNAYKKLDNLCKDLLSTNAGISTYIELLKPLSPYKYQDEYNHLMHYRSIRNKIAHADNITEEDVSNDADIIWLREFYHRIITETDPLALERKRQQNRFQQPQSQPRQSNVPFQTTPLHPTMPNQRSALPKVILFILIASSAFLIGFVLLLALFLAA